MCGIAGWMIDDAQAFGRADAAALQRALHHRGPDDSGVHLLPRHGLALVHTRLSILDLSERGHQPMLDEAGGDALIFNGEIYNHAELRARLVDLGHAFHSTSDTEVLLRALVTWGIEALAQVRGMYAFAFWSERDATLHLARDPMGIKPLYLWPGAAGSGIAFASELRALTVLPGLRPRVDRTALDQFMEFGYTFDDTRTILQGVQRLPPGHRVEVRDGRAGPWIRHFSPSLETAPASAAADLELELHDTLSEVVGEHLHADVPVALLLSGGLDSSLLAALAMRHTRVHTFSFGFDDSPIDERASARAVAQHLGTRHEEILFGPDDLLDALDGSIAHFDDLFADWGLVTTRLMYQRCRDRGAKVVLVGEGADELFGGYRARFGAALDRSPLAPLDWRLFQLYRRYIGRRHGTLFWRFRRIMHEHLTCTGGDLFAAIRLFESRQQLPGNYVMKVDKASMSTSVEARTPYLDERVARIAYRVPGELLLDRHGEKQLLRNMAHRFELLPDCAVKRAKFGASIAAGWMDSSADFRAFAADVVTRRSGWVDALGLRRAMTAYFRDNRQGFAFPHPIGIFPEVAWRLLLLNLWSERLGVDPEPG